MAYGDVDVVAQVLTSVLLRVSTDLSTAGRPVDRIFRSAGSSPALDCAQLSAWSNHQALPVGDARGTRRVSQHAITVFVQLTRCLTVIPEGIPTEAEMDADGAGFAVDQWVMGKALVTWPDVPPCSVIRYEGITADRPSTHSSMTGRVLVGLT